MQTIHVTDQMFQKIMGTETSQITSFCEQVPGLGDKIRIVASSGRYRSEYDLWLFRYVIAVNDLTELTDDENLVRLTVSAVPLPF